MKVLLISANTLKAPYPVYPLGLDYVAAALEPRHTVQILDLNALAEEDLTRAVAAFEPDLTGLSLRNVDTTDRTDPRGFLVQYRRLAGLVRQATGAPMVLGGSGFSLFPAEILAALGADFGIVGEGERLSLLADALEAGRDPAGVPGLITPQASGPPPSSAEETFRRRPAAGAGHLAYYLRQGGMLNLQTQRGCPFRCTYCTYPLIEGRRLRRADPDAVASEAVALQGAGARYLFITDSSFNADVDHSLAVAAAFRRAGLKIPWGAFFTPRRGPAGYFEQLVAAGCTHVEFGTDALCDPVLAAYGKPFDTAAVLSAHREAAAAGLHVAHYLLLGGPRETAATVEETLGQVDRLERSVIFFFCAMRIYPNTGLWRRAVAEGAIRADTPLLEPVFYRSGAVGADWIQTRIETEAARRVNWVVGAGGAETVAILSRMYRRGFTGPLWEYLIR